MNDEYDYDDERKDHKKSEYEEWRESDYAQRYREWQSDNTRPY